MSEYVNKEDQVAQAKDAFQKFYDEYIQDAPDYYYDLYIPEGLNKEKYSAFVKQFDRGDNTILGKTLFEAKVIPFSNQWILLDKEVLDYLKTFVRDKITFLQYICFTPDNTIIFNLSEMEEKKLLRFEPSKKIAGKFVAVLKLHQGIKFSYIYEQVPLKPVESASIKQTSAIPTPKVKEMFPEEKDQDWPDPLVPNPTQEKPKEMFPEEAEDVITDPNPVNVKRDGNKWFDETNKVWRDENDQIVITTPAEMRTLSKELQKEFADRHFIMKNLPDKEQWKSLIARHETVHAAAQELRQQVISSIGSKK